MIPVTRAHMSPQGSIEICVTVQYTILSGHGQNRPHIAWPSRFLKSTCVRRARYIRLSLSLVPSNIVSYD